jgi:hypothetical protein
MSWKLKGANKTKKEITPLIPNLASASSTGTVSAGSMVSSSRSLAATSSRTESSMISGMLMTIWMPFSLAKKKKKVSAYIALRVTWSDPDDKKQLVHKLVRLDDAAEPAKLRQQKARQPHVGERSIGGPAGIVAERELGEPVQQHCG